MGEQVTCPKEYLKSLDGWVGVGLSEMKWLRTEQDGQSSGKQQEMVKYLVLVKSNDHFGPLGLKGKGGEVVRTKWKVWLQPMGPTERVSAHG